MDSMKDILAKLPSHDKEPPEVAAIKRYINDSFGLEAQVAAKAESISIIVSSAAFAGTLRLKINDIKKAANTKKRIFIRIA